MRFVQVGVEFNIVHEIGFPEIETDTSLKRAHIHCIQHVIAIVHYFTGDPIFGVIRGSATNQDGPSATLTAPSGQS